MSARLIYGVHVLEGLKQLDDESVHCVVTSPPYWGLRDYGVPGQLGLEETPEEFIRNMVEVFREVRRVLRKDGTIWVNMGDSYASNPCTSGKSFRRDRHITHPSKTKRIPRGSGRWGGGGVSAPSLKPKDLVGIPWMLAFALRADGWFLRSDIVWAKKNPMPESVKDRPTKSHEYIFLLSRSGKYYFDYESVKEPRSSEHVAGVGGWASGSEPHDAINHSRDKGNSKTFRGGQYVNGNKFKNSHAIERDSVGNAPAAGTDRNCRSVWSMATEPFKEAHFATFPKELPYKCILAGCPMGGTVLDPFSGSGTTGLVATGMGRKYIGIDLNLEYLALAQQRIGIFIS